MNEKLFYPVIESPDTGRVDTIVMNYRMTMDQAKGYLRKNHSYLYSICQAKVMRFDDTRIKFVLTKVRRVIRPTPRPGHFYMQSVGVKVPYVIQEEE